MTEPSSLDLLSGKCGRGVKVWFVYRNLGCRGREGLWARLDLYLINHVDKVGKALSSDGM